MRIVKGITRFPGLMLLILFTRCATNASFIYSTDNTYFEESPDILITNNKYFLKFRYSRSDNFHFFLTTSSKIKNGKLLFYINSTSSSGNMINKNQFEEIRTETKIELIQHKSAYWLEPNGNIIKLEIETNDNVIIDKYLENIH